MNLILTQIHRQVTNEAESNYVFQNLAKYAGNTTTADGNTTVIDLQDPAFVETNMMHSINGRIYSNLEGLNLTAGSRARFVHQFSHQLM